MSFAATISSNNKTEPKFPKIKLANRQYGVKEGVPSFSFSSLEYQAHSSKFVNMLIVKFQSGRPPLESIKVFISGNRNSTGRITISSIWDDRHIVVIMDSSDDVNSALICSYRRIDNSYFCLFRWSSDYNPKKWVPSPNLPIELFDVGSLCVIASLFAIFLGIDAKTKDLSALSFARACIEIDISKPLPDKVWISLPNDRGFYQDIIFEGNMAYCTKCKLHGHDLVSCCKIAKVSKHATKESITKPATRDVIPNPVIKEAAPKLYGPDELLKATKPVYTVPKPIWTKITKRKAARETIYSVDTSETHAKSAFDHSVATVTTDTPPTVETGIASAQIH